MNIGKSSLHLLIGLIFSVSIGSSVGFTESLDDVVAAAKKEGEMTFIAGAQTYGGRKGFAEIEAGFAKRYGFTPRLNFAAGPSMPARAARIITELKTGSKSSSTTWSGWSR